MAVSKRLQAIVSLIKGHCLADIGCDHGYVIMEALQQKRIQKAYACDVAPGPLDNAKRNIHLHHLEEQVTCLLMDGMKELPSDVDSIVIAGMGASLMIHILEQGKSHIKKGMHFYFCPHKDASLLREYVSKQGFRIEQECVVEEDGHFYPIMKLVYTNTPYFLTQSEILYGVSCRKDATYSSFLQKEQEKWKQIVAHMPKHKRTEANQRLQILENMRRQS